jgi:malic enzyme
LLLAAGNSTREWSPLLTFQTPSYGVEYNTRDLTIFFPGIFRGALNARAICNRMKIAAARTIASFVCPTPQPRRRRMSSAMAIPSSTRLAPFVRPAPGVLHEQPDDELAEAALFEPEPL